MKQKKKECHFLKFKFRPMFTEPARAKELRREIIPLPKETSPSSTALRSHWLFAAYGTVFRHRRHCFHSLKRAKVVLDLSAWQKKT